ncbi:Transcription factor tau subunit sfc4 like protein [Verticillium longisporum]|uniref:Transcription factor tau subunit sfc4 like protein n=1 Tax=Verticillium longisporum TaxID=100787 RepID=A0A8I2ZMI7_VERLO|nr:Transcription factor tau subunit sfc4 like protein [Verticillium longisporum]
MGDQEESSVDDSNIDARIELAKIYEDAREDEEALILVTEAIALQGAGEHAYRAVRGKTDAKFYTWDKYVKYLGASEGIVFNAPMETQYGTGTSELHELAERLSRNVAPSQGDDGRVHVPSDDDGHRGIPFGEWLELFLDFAISLALEGHGHEAYQVCEAARDSIVFVNSKDFMFLIHVAWAACAIYLGDEEMCVAMARFFTKVQQLDSDSYRMFAALSIPMPSTTFYGPARSTL